MTTELMQRVTDWCRAHRQWGRTLNIGHVRRQISLGRDSEFWWAVMAQYLPPED